MQSAAIFLTFDGENLGTRLCIYIIVGCFKLLLSCTILVILAGGLMSIFLMGVWDPATKQWCTVAKCGNGHDDETIEKLNRELKMKKISKV